MDKAHVKIEENNNNKLTFIYLFIYTLYLRHFSSADNM